MSLERVYGSKYLHYSGSVNRESDSIGHYDPSFGVHLDPKVCRASGPKPALFSDPEPYKPETPAEFATSDLGCSPLC